MAAIYYREKQEELGRRLLSCFIPCTSSSDPSDLLQQQVDQAQTWWTKEALVLSPSGKSQAENNNIAVKDLEPLIWWITISREIKYMMSIDSKGPCLLMDFSKNCKKPKLSLEISTGKMKPDDGIL
ncbi:hypothetical protein L484_012436 [Morus notabilis]|uniref:Uncharacterized protein n=1 Tax=Morus notabilis TaxID=981085 RepID=W9RQ94_9ROSA|nr:hypothetical protein L484_012436 [Morus notabilis]